jgi:hypothetical protein
MGYNRIVTIFYTLFLMCALPVGVLLSIMSERDYYTDMSQWEGSNPAEVAAMYGDSIRESFNVQLTSLVLPLALLFLVIWCARNFSYMQGRRSVDLFHALPVRRTPLFMGSYAAGLVCTLLPLAVGVGVTELVCHLNGVEGVAANPALFWEAFAVMALPLVGAMTFTAFFMVVSGNPLNWFLMTAAVTLGWPVVVFLCDQTMSAFLPGYVSVLPGTLYVLFSPYFAPFLIIPNALYYIFMGAYDEMGYTPGTAAEELYTIPVEYLIWWVVFSILLLAVTLLYYRRRKSECAENPFSFPVARGMVRSLMTVGGSLGLGLVLGTLLNSNLFYLLGLALGAVVAHTVYQAVITRGFRRFWTTIPALVVTAALIGGGLYTLYTGGAGYVKRIPDAGNVELADFTLPDIPGDESKECYLADNTYGEVGLYGANMDLVGNATPRFREQGEVELLTALHRTALDKYPGPYLPFGKEEDYNVSRTFTVTYQLKNGGAVKRSYTLPIYEEDKEILSALAQVQKSKTIQSTSPFYSTQPKRVGSIAIYRTTDEYEYDASNDQLTQEEKEKIWNTFASELSSAAFRNPTDLLTREESQKLIERNGQSDPDEPVLQGEGNQNTYTINVSAIPMRELSEETKAFIEREGESQSTILGMDSSSYSVPECCVKTRKLIDKLTENNSTYYYYNEEDEDEEDEFDEEDFGDESAEGWQEGSGIIRNP